MISGINNNFLGLDEKLSNFETSKVVILPVGYEQTVSYMSGTRNGPKAIIEASKYVELFDIELDRDISNIGICTLDEMEPIMSGPADLQKELFSLAKDILDRDKFLVTFGGEHSISVPLARAHKERYHDLTVIQFDAHSDLRDSYLGTKYSHASCMKRISEFSDTVQVGIRSMSEEENLLIKSEDKKIFYASDIKGKTSWLENLFANLNNDIYITFDFDFFDPSIMPSVGTPEPGGFLWYETVNILKELVKMKNVVGFDMVELCPIDSIKAPDFLAAKLAYKLLGLIFNNRSL